MKRHLLLCVVLAIGLALRLYKIDTPLADWHSFRQADTASVAHKYVKNGINIFRPTYHDVSDIQSGRDNPQGYRMVEMPLVSALVASVYRLKLVSSLELHVVYRLVNIAFSLLAGVSLFHLAKKEYDATTALTVLGVYLVLPFSIYYSRTTLPDVPAMALAVSALWMTQSRGWGKYILGIITAALSLLIKPTAAFILFAMPLMLFRTTKDSKSLKMLMLLAVPIPLIVWRMWIQQFPEGIPVSGWLLNSNNIRFSGAFFRWIFAERIGKIILGYWGLIFLYAGIKKIKALSLTAALLMGSVLYLTIFAAGNVQHDYYQIIILPTMSMLVGIGLISEWGQSVVRKILITVIVLASLAFSWYEVRGYYNINNWAIVHAGQAVDKLIPQNALVIAPYMGDTAFLYQTNRSGWPIGFNIQDKINMGASYYVSTSYDDEARELESKYTTVEKTDEYILIDLTKKKV